MNSMILHKMERNLFRLIFIAVIMVICLWTLEQMYEVDYRLTEIGFVASALLILTYERLANIKMRDWRQQGNELSKELDLKSLIIFPSNLLQSPVQEYELHLKLNTFKQGLLLRKNIREENIEGLKVDFKEDFHKMYGWMLEQKKSGKDILIHTTTHESLAYLWGKAAYDYFELTKINKKLDPYVEMNYLQWILATFCTTGSIKWRKPVKWNSYLINIRENE